MTEEWIILVSQVVVGKSKFPHNKVGKFQRYKPWPYRDSNKPHRIVYARSFRASEEEALKKAKQVDEEMFSTYVMGMGSIDHTCVEDYTVTLHNITKNESRQMSSTLDDSEMDNYMFDGAKCNNSNLGRWKIVRGLR